MSLRDENIKEVTGKPEEPGLQNPEGTEQSPDMENDSEGIDSPEALEQKKREVNDFHAEGNLAQNQIFIQDVGSGGFTVNYYAQKLAPVNTRLPVEKSYDLRKQEECIEFVETFKNSEYFTTAVVLSALEAVALSELPDLKSKLLCALPEEEGYCDGGAKIQLPEKNPYLAVNSVLAVIGGMKFSTEDGCRCVSLGENSIQALYNILEQFPDLQAAVAQLLIQAAKENKYHTVFYECRIASSLAGIIAVNMKELGNRVLEGLYEDPGNVYLLAAAAYKLYAGENRALEAEAMIGQWLQADGTWLWRAVCLAYAIFQENQITVSFEEELRNMLSEKISRLRVEDISFLAELLMQSKQLRTMLCNIYGIAYERAETAGRGKGLAQSYIRLVRHSYYRVSSSFMELPLVACDTKQQQVKLTAVVERIMGEYRLRRQLYAILKAYLKELSQYEFSERVIRHIAAYFYNICRTGKDYREDIIDFLMECSGGAARQIVDLLCKTNDKGAGLQ